MDERAIYGGVLLVLVAGSVLALGLSAGSSSGAPPVPEPGVDTDADVRTTASGARYTVHPSELRQGCPGGKDCIPSIDDPEFEPAGEAAWLRSDDLVVGVEIAGEVRAYPLRILNLHEVVNDEIAGRPVAVTYCPLCRSGLVFSRAVNGRTLAFGVSGKLLDANLVLYDRETGTYWSQIRGAAIVGPLVPTELDILPSTITTWEQWRDTHPDTLVLSRDTGIYPASTYGSNPYEGYEQRDRVGFGVDRVDDRLPSKELVYGVAVGGAARAYPESLVRERDVVNDEVGDVPVLIVEAGDGVRAFVRETPNGTVTFRAAEDGLVDADGNRWSFDGEALEGPHTGTRLDRIETHGFYWFAWSSFHPETGIYGRNASSTG